MLAIGQEENKRLLTMSLLGVVLAAKCSRKFSAREYMAASSSLVLQKEQWLTEGAVMTKKNYEIIPVLPQFLDLPQGENRVRITKFSVIIKK